MSVADDQVVFRRIVACPVESTAAQKVLLGHDTDVSWPPASMTLGALQVAPL
jgi:hypothetical protein